MTELKHLLVAIDFNESSQEAIATAVALAKRLSAALTVTHTWEVPAYTYPGLALVPADLLGPVEEAARSAVAATLADVHKQVPWAKSVLRQGLAANETLALIEETKPDLVVIGTHGRKGVARALLGSVAERIIRLSRAPVLTVRHLQDGPLQTEGIGSSPLPQRILVPHDFSDGSHHALSFALVLAARLGALVTVLHAYEIPVGFPSPLQVTADLLGAVHASARKELDEVVALARRPGVVVESLLCQGPAWSEIDTAARERRADLIVMGTHGRRGIARALLGSVAEKVVRTATCPVLTVHGPDDTR
jgi:nucleotide-binding universal stress UspA family protein